MAKSPNLPIGQSMLSSRKSRNLKERGKINKTQWLVVHHQVYQNMPNMSNRWRGEKGAEIIFVEIMAKNFPNLTQESH